MLFAGDFQYSRDGLVVIFQYMSNVIGNVLRNQNDSDIIPLRKCLEGILHLHKLRVGLDDEKVGGVGRSVANSSEEETSYGVLCGPNQASNPVDRQIQEISMSMEGERLDRYQIKYENTYHSEPFMA